MNKLFSGVAEFLSEPQYIPSRIMHDRPFKLAFAGYFTGALSLFIWMTIEKGPLSLWAALASILVFFVLEIVLGYLFSAAAHAFLEYSGAKGRASGLFVLTGASEFVKILLIAVAPILLYLSSMIHIHFKPVFALVAFAQIYVLSLMIRKAYSTSKTKAWISVFIPIVIASTILVALSIITVGALILSLLAALK